MVNEISFYYIPGVPISMIGVKHMDRFWGFRIYCTEIEDIKILWNVLLKYEKTSKVSEKVITTTKKLLFIFVLLKGVGRFHWECGTLIIIKRFQFCPHN